MAGRRSDRSNACSYAESNPNPDPDAHALAFTFAESFALTFAKSFSKPEEETGEGRFVCEQSQAYTEEAILAFERGSHLNPARWKRKPHKSNLLLSVKQRSEMVD